MMIDEKAVTKFLKQQGFEGMNDYYDIRDRPAPVSGLMFQFYNPATKEGIQFCISDANDDLSFGDSFEQQKRTPINEDKITIKDKPFMKFMKQQGFERIIDWSDKSMCFKGKVMQFYNIKTEIGVQICIGPIDDDIMFGEEFAEEIKKKWGDKNE